MSDEIYALMYQTLKDGALPENVLDILLNAESIDEFVDKLKSFKKEMADDGESSEQTSVVVKYADEISKLYSEMEKIQSMSEDLKAGKMPSMSDILGIAETHPEFMTVIGDMEAMQKMLQQFAKGDADALTKRWEGWAANSEAVYQNFKNTHAIVAGAEQASTLKEYKDWLEANNAEGKYAEQIAAVAAVLEAVAEGARNATKAVFSLNDALDQTSKALSSNKSMENTAQQQLENLRNGTGLDADSMLSLAKDNNAILSALASNNYAALEKALQDSVQQYQKAGRQIWRDLFDQKGFQDHKAQIDQLKDIDLEGIDSLTALRDALQAQDMEVPLW